MNSGFFKPNPLDLNPEASWWGYKWTDTWLTAHVRDASGKFYIVWFVLGRDASGKVVATYQDITTSSPNGTVHESRLQNQWTVAWNQKGPIGAQIDDVKWKVSPEANRISTKDHEIVLGAKEVSWKDKAGLLDLKGVNSTPGVHILTAWRKPNSSESGINYYTEVLYLVEGTLLGEKVKGVMVFDNSWGTVPYGKDYAASTLHGSWNGWLTQYDDGTVENGFFICGSKQFRTGFYTNNKNQEFVFPNNFKFDYELQPDNFAPARTKYEFNNGEKWEWIGRPEQSNKNYTAFDPNFVVVNGQMRRVGEKRKIVNWWSQMEWRKTAVCTSQSKPDWK